MRFWEALHQFIVFEWLVNLFRGNLHNKKPAAPRFRDDIIVDDIDTMDYADYHRDDIDNLVDDSHDDFDILDDYEIYDELDDYDTFDYFDDPVEDFDDDW